MIPEYFAERKIKATIRARILGLLNPLRMVSIVARATRIIPAAKIASFFSVPIPELVPQKK